MRDPNRIYELMMTLASIWQENVPDWRFGQLVSNVLGEDPFYIEDEEMIKRFQDYFKSKNN